MSEQDKAEYQRIEATVRATEQVVANNPHLRKDAAAAFLEPAKRRIEEMERTGLGPHQEDKERRKQEGASIAIAFMVMAETRLTSHEKSVYGSFLQSNYFTQYDFGKLEEFYADGSAWDRLSENGKKQMSERFWAGIENGQYRFQEAPTKVREKEAEQLAFYFTNPDKAPDSVNRMNQQAKDAFIRAHQSGNKIAVYDILDRQDLFESAPMEKTQSASAYQELTANDAPKGEIGFKDDGSKK